MFPQHISKIIPYRLLFQTKRSYSFELPSDKAYINGKWVSSESGRTFTVTNPANGAVVSTVADCNVTDLNNAIASAHEAFKSWSTTTAKERGSILKHLFDKQIKYAKDLAQLMTLEVGKPIKEAEGEIVYGASFLEWFAEEARRIYGDIVPTPFKNKQALFVREPIGVAGIITPWNFPNAMITRKVAAALAAGCTCVVKPAEATPLSALAFAKLADMVKVPPGVINILPVSRNNTTAVGQALCESRKIATISFTGSTEVGKILLEQSASTVKKVSLELGGNAPFIVFKSANLDNAISGLMASKFRNSGQTCVCTNRILVQEEVHDVFVSKLSDIMKKQLVVGDGFDPNVTIGPLIDKTAVMKVTTHVKDALKLGAKIVYQGAGASGENFFPPTLLTDVTTNMLVCQEETFGPVAAVIKFKTEEEAISIANESRCGLAGYFYSEDISQIWRVAKKLQVGMVGINEGIISMAEAAFGGVKESGLGREGSRYGIDEYVQMKYMCFGNLN